MFRLDFLFTFIRLFNHILHWWNLTSFCRKIKRIHNPNGSQGMTLIRGGASLYSSHCRTTLLSSASTSAVCCSKATLWNTQQTTILWATVLGLYCRSCSCEPAFQQPNHTLNNAPCACFAYIILILYHSVTPNKLCWRRKCHSLHLLSVPVSLPGDSSQFL